MTTEELERRVTLLEDIEAIKQLKARYCSICDDDHNPDLITTIFAADGIWQGDAVGAHRGHAAIRKLFESFRARISFSQLTLINYIIEVDGNGDKVSWYFFGRFFFRNG